MPGELGTDIQKVSRIEQVIEEQGDQFLDRIYTANEQEFCDRFNNELRVQMYTAFWAMKEAVMKALGTGARGGVTYRNIEVVHAPSGKPSVKLYGGAKSVFDEQGFQHTTITMSHLDDYAIAVALFE